MRTVIGMWLGCALLLLGTSCPQAKPGLASGAGVGATGAAPAVAAQVSASAPQGASLVWLTTMDQYKVSAWYWPAKGSKSAPAMILLHQRGKDKSSWGTLPGKLAAEGYAVIAIDLRGHGETLDPLKRPIPLDSLADSQYQAMLNDVAAAHAYLATCKGVDADRVGIIGASIGANLALLYGGNDRRVRTIIVLSPGLDYKSLKPLGAMPGLDKRPLFLIASKGDKYSADSIAALQQAAVKEAPITVRLFEGKDHGTDLLKTQTGLDETIINGWLMNYLPPGTPGPT